MVDARDNKPRTTGSPSTAALPTASRGKRRLGGLALANSVTDNKNKVRTSAVATEPFLESAASDAVQPALLKPHAPKTKLELLLITPQTSIKYQNFFGESAKPTISHLGVLAQSARVSRWCSDNHHEEHQRDIQHASTKRAVRTNRQRRLSTRQRQKTPEYYASNPSSAPPTQLHPQFFSFVKYRNFYFFSVQTSTNTFFARYRPAAASVPSCLARALMWQPPPKSTTNAEYSALVARQSQVRDYMTKVAYR